MSMEPSQTPPAPPPLPVQPSRDPYEFITNEPELPKKRLLPGNGSKKQRIFIIIGGAVFLVMLAYLVIGLLGRADRGRQADYLSLAQQQAELIRISEIGAAKSRGSEAKNLALNVKFTQVSEQPAILDLVKKSGLKTEAKTLALGKNTKTDALLTTAGQNNEFDAVFIKTISELLKKYQLTLKKLHDSTSSSSAKATLAKSYNNASNLIDDQKQ